MKSTIKPVEFPIPTSCLAVQELYAKFENIKQRISNSDSKRSTRSIDRKHYLQKHQDSKIPLIGNISPLPLSALMTQLSDSVKEDQSALKLTPPQTENQQAIKAFAKHLLTSFKQLEESYLTRTHALMSKLALTEQKLTKISTTLKEKKTDQQPNQKTNSSFNENINNTTRCHTFKSLSQNTIQNHFMTISKFTAEQSEQRLRLERSSIIENYEQKISDKMEGNSQKNVKSLSKGQYIGLEMITKSEKLEELMAEKQKSIKDLTAQNKRLKRMLQQAKMNFERNGELNKLLKEENKMLESTVQKLEGWKKQYEAQKKNDECEIEKLKTELRIRSLEIKKLKEELEGNFNNGSKLSKNQFKLDESKKVIREDKPRKNSQKISEIEQVLTERSYHLDNDPKIVQNINSPQRANKFEELELKPDERKSLKRSHSLVMNGTQFELINSLRRQKGLFVQVLLLEEEARLLKWKKDKFQAEVKKSQDDEDMMQQQLGRLNQEIRRLNGACRLLDEYGYKLIKGESLAEAQIAQLQNDSKLKEEFMRQKEKKKRGFSLRR